MEREAMQRFSPRLDLFLGQPNLGFVWLAYAEGEPAAIYVVCFAISTSIGEIVAKLDDVYGPAGKQKRDIHARFAILNSRTRRRRTNWLPQSKIGCR
jgi:hypothetical protein